MDFGAGDATLLDPFSSSSIAACATPLRRVRPPAEAMRQVVLLQGGVGRELGRESTVRRKCSVDIH